MPTLELTALIALAVGLPGACFVTLSVTLRRARRQAQETARAAAWAKMEEFYRSGGPDRTYLA